MRTSTQRYRQDAEAFRNRLNRILAGGGPKQGRIAIDTTGNRSRAAPAKSSDQRLRHYGERRFESVARIMAVMQIARETEQLHAHPHRIGVEACGAIWQAFSGTAESNACHTCPTHLLLDGQHPTLITKNRGLRRCMIVEFADCVLMPREINEIDIVVDDLVGRSAFVDATELVLNEAGTTWHDGLELFTKHARELLAPVQEILFNPTAGRFLADDRADGVRLDALAAYYEGIFLTVLNPNEIEVFAGRVRAEMNIP